VKIMEYMAAAKPIVAFDLAETRFSAGEAAVYARPNDELGFATLLSALIDAPRQRQKMGCYGSQRIRESLAWKYSVPALLRAYDSFVPAETNTSHLHQNVPSNNSVG
jgi:glycosyltransferase involved in cell wall biosynthesis